MLPYALHLGDCIEVLRTQPDNSVDSIVTDPPYELGFMGKGWDKSGIANNIDMWRESLRVLKPGGHLLAFSGSRTYHRMVCAIEDAGFEVRDRVRFECAPETKYGALWDSLTDDQRGALLELLNDQAGLGSELAWEYGSGFPKSRNLDGEWEGWGTALKPAHEPICVARKPLVGTVAANVLTHGTGALNIDACRVEPTGESRPRVGEASQERRYTDNGGTNFAATPGVRGGDPSGRWPANVIHDGSDEVLEAFPDAPGQMARARTDGAAQGNNTYGALSHVTKRPEPRGDTGSAARFFYCAKASRADRGAENTHPTVKPTDLMAYLCRLVTPPGGLVLDLFMGSGSTGKAAIREGFRFIGIDMTPAYVEIAKARISHEFERVEAARAAAIAEPLPPQIDLFDAA